MNYFAKQWKLLKDSYVLVLLFLLCAVGMILTINFMFYYLYSFISSSLFSLSYFDEVPQNMWQAQLILTVFIITSMVIVYILKLTLLHSGGPQIAEYYGGTRIKAADDYYTTRYKNIVEELAIASRIPIPAMFIMQNNENINAFAAGGSPEDAAICISNGALKKLNRDELQAVIAHEFSHIVHHDMRLNMQLIALQGSINWIGESIRAFNILKYSHTNNFSVILLLPFIILFYPASAIGSLFAALLKLGVNRKREFLADASSIHYTRLSIGLIGALKKIAGTTDSTSNKADDLQSISHMMFVSTSTIKNIFSSHPSIIDRIKAIDPYFSEDELNKLKSHYEKFTPNGMEEDRALGFYSGANDDKATPVTPIEMPAYKKSGATETTAKPVNINTIIPKLILSCVFLFLALIAYHGTLFFYDKFIAISNQPPGILVYEEPKFDESSNLNPFTLNGFEITTVGSYTIKARVLAVEHYSSDFLSPISPADFLLGWGVMSDSAVLDQLQGIRISERTYAYFNKSYSDSSELINNITMTIIIPASPEVAKIANTVKKNNIVTLSGYAVDIKTPKGHQIKSNVRINPVTRESMYILLWTNEIFIH